MENQVLYTACVTPFCKLGKIDYTSLEKILKNQEQAGNGILLLGSTGESLSLSLEEKKEIMNFACSLNLKSKIIVGVPNNNLQDALNWIDFCNNLPIHGYLCATPLYTKPGVVGQIKWFETLLNKMKYKVMLYNIPGRTGVKLYKDVVKELLSHDKLFAIKDSGGQIDNFMEYKIISSKIKIYCGDDYLVPALCAIGAYGSISVASNAWAKEFRNHVITHLKREQDTQDLTVWWNATHALFKASNPIPVKALMKHKGLIQEDTVRLPLSADDLDAKSLLELVKYDNMVQI